MENMKVNKKNNKPVICRTSIDILENKIKDLLYERETNLKMVEMAQETNLSIITSQKEIILALGEEIEKLKEEYKKDIRQGQLWKSREKQKKQNDVLKQEIEKLKGKEKEYDKIMYCIENHPDYESMDITIHPDFKEVKEGITCDLKQEIEKLKEPKKSFSEEINEVITDKLNEDIEDIIKSKEEEDKKYFNTIQNLKDELEEEKGEARKYFDECETLKEENVAIRTFIRQNGLAKLHTKIKQLNEEITFLRTQAGLENL